MWPTKGHKIKEFKEFSVQIGGQIIFFPFQITFAMWSTVAKVKVSEYIPK